MVYTGNKLKEISFPLGGIGTGSIGLAGNGILLDWEIYNRPAKGSKNGHTHFAIKAEYPDGRTVTKILQGDWTKDLVGKYSKGKFSGYGFGPSGGYMCSFPHFKKVKFDGKFPIATLTFEDDNFPAKVILKAFNPFIPLDADNSSIPAAFFDIKVNSFEENIKYTVVFAVSNPFNSSTNQKVESDKYTAIKMKSAAYKNHEKEYGDLTVAVNRPNGINQEYWYRGAWLDGITTYWHELTDGELKPRHYDEIGKFDHCCVGASEVVSKNKIANFKFVLSWNVPNNYNYWNPYKDENDNDVIWKNYYATVFEDSTASCYYSLDNWDFLYKKTNRFCKALHSCSFDKAVIDAISSTISVLKSPTVYRLEDGTFYGFEGVHELVGSCEGTCTHVWSYAYALCFLFPELERSLRDTEFKYDTTKDGWMMFRTNLPLGRGYFNTPPCVDGQMATIIKIYRDWKLTGNSKWLEENWENIKLVLEFAWNEKNTYEWDMNKDGILEGRQHHTLDMELFGPSSWLQGMYLCALKAAAEIAEFLGHNDKRDEYMAIFKNSYKWTKENLFNGEYFFHKVDLKNKEYIDHFNCPKYWNEEKNELKYQIADGCEIDQLLGQWHSNICGLGDIFNKEQRKTALKNMLKYNVKESLREFANMWRVFALNNESAAIMCDYPDGKKKPIIPIPYCEECMTGFEYSFAGLLISEGFIEEGVKVIRAVRDRYDGKKRNPWNEIECGSNYARPMSSYALIPIFSGFEFDLPKNHIGFSPILDGSFKSIWHIGTGWGEIIKNENGYKIILCDGFVTLKTLNLGGISTVKSIYVDGKAIEFKQDNTHLSFNLITAKKEIKVEV